MFCINSSEKASCTKVKRRRHCGGLLAQAQGEKEAPLTTVVVAQVQLVRAEEERGVPLAQETLTP